MVKINITRQMTGTQFEVADFDELFKGLKKTGRVTIRINQGDRFGTDTTVVTVTEIPEETKNTVGGAR